MARTATWSTRSRAIRAAIAVGAGLLLLFNVYVRLGILVLWLPFNVSLAAFGWRELVGHLPIYGTMAVLALWGTGGETDFRALGRGLRQRPALLDETVT